MVESFENLEDILPDWANKGVEKSLAKAVDKFQKQEEEKNKFLCRKRLKQNTPAASSNHH